MEETNCHRTAPIAQSEESPARLSVGYGVGFVKSVVLANADLISENLTHAASVITSLRGLPRSRSVNGSKRSGA